MTDGMYHCCPACAGEMRSRTHAELEGDYETRMFSSPSTHVLRCSGCGADWQFTQRWQDDGTLAGRVTTLAEEVSEFTTRRLEMIVRNL